MDDTTKDVYQARVAAWTDRIIAQKHTPKLTADGSLDIQAWKTWGNYGPMCTTCCARWSFTRGGTDKIMRCSAIKEG